MQNSTLIWVIVAALIILGGGWYFLNNGAVPAGEEASETTEETGQGPGDGAGIELGADVEVGAGTGGSSEEGAAPMTAQVSYSSAGFAPSTVTVKVGGTVTWTDNGTGKMWVASAQHPTHTAYSDTTLQEHCDDAVDTSFDQCKNSSSYSFKFTKAGTWRYHNHSASSHFGIVIVEQ